MEMPLDDDCAEIMAVSETTGKEALASGKACRQERDVWHQGRTTVRQEAAHCASFLSIDLS
jgi:hypothetical protein